MSLSRITAGVIFLTGLAALLRYLFARKQAELRQHVGGTPQLKVSPAGVR